MPATPGYYWWRKKPGGKPHVAKFDGTWCWLHGWPCRWTVEDFGGDWLQLIQEL